MIGIEVSGIFGILLLALNIWAIIRIVDSGASTGSRVLWILVILLLPLFGVILWLLFGPRR